MAAVPVSGRLPKGRILLKSCLRHFICIQGREHLLPKVCLRYCRNTLCPHLTAIDPHWFLQASCILSDPLFQTDLMSGLLLWVCSRADEIWIWAPVELCELCVKWYAVWVSKRTRPVSHCLHYVSLTGWLSALSHAERGTSVECVLHPVCVCFYVHDRCASHALLLVGSSAIQLQWWTWRSRLTDWQTEMMWWKLPLTTFVSLPPPSPNDEPW